MEVSRVITLRTMATAFIFNKDKVLLMERSKERKLAPGIWAAVGGHIESNEMNFPKVACLREIEEETGLVEEQLYALDLRYIIMRKCDKEIRIQYVYIGKTNETNIKQCDEGLLYWIPELKLFDRTLSFTTKMTLKHYIEHRNNLDKIIVGVVNEDCGSPIMNWNMIEDWNSNSLV